MAYEIDRASEILKDVIDEVTKGNMSNLVESLRDVYNRLNNPNNGYIQWSIEDFLGNATDNGFILSIEKAQEALGHMIDKHDCTIGITWDTVEYYVREYATKSDDFDDED